MYKCIENMSSIQCEFLKLPLPINKLYLLFFEQVK